PPPACRYAQRTTATGEQAALYEPVEHSDREIACKMVIAGARLAQFGIARTGADAGVAGAGSKRNQPFKRARDVGVGEAEIAVPPLAFDRDKSGIFELGEMPAGGREHEARFLGKLGCRERGTGHQRHEHIGTSRIADQRRDDRDVGSFLHSLIISEVYRGVNMKRCALASRDRDEEPMVTRIHDIGIARQIGTYSDAVEVSANARWLITAGTPGLDTGGKVPPDFGAQAELPWRH